MNAGLNGVVGAWASHDAYSAGQWLNRNAAHPACEKLAATYSTEIAPLNPMMAVQWANSIEDAGGREGAVRSVAASVLNAH